MACLFCSSSFHLSQNCEIYSSDESRKEILAQNKICVKCLKHFPRETYIENFEPDCNCTEESKVKCYICFSKNHNTMFCNQRKRFNFCVSKLDADLHSRFFKILDIREKYSLAFSSQKLLRLLKPKKIAARNYIGSKDIAENFKADFLIGHWVYLYSDFQMSSNLINLLVSKSFSIYSERITITDISNFSRTFFLLLLSRHTTKLSCKNVKFVSEVKFSEILQRIPNIQEIELMDTNIEIENSWLEDLVKYKEGNNFDRLSVEIKNSNFDTEKLVEFMTTRMSADSNVILNVGIVQIMNSFLLPSFTDLIYSERLFIRAKSICLCNISNFPIQFLYRIFVSKTTTFSCKNVTFDSGIKFSEILSKIPNVQDLELMDTNVEIENSWPEDLLKLNNGRNMKKLSLKIDNFDLDFGKLKEFMTLIVYKGFCIRLEINQTQTNEGIFLSNLKKKIFQHFVAHHFNDPSILNINHIINDPNAATFAKSFLLSPIICRAPDIVPGHLRWGKGRRRSWGWGNY